MAYCLYDVNHTQRRVARISKHVLFTHGSGPATGTTRAERSYNDARCMMKEGEFYDFGVCGYMKDDAKAVHVYVRIVSTMIDGMMECS